jgi:hypothetical protein
MEGSNNSATKGLVALFFFDPIQALLTHKILVERVFETVGILETCGAPASSSLWQKSFADVTDSSNTLGKEMKKSL